MADGTDLAVSSGKKKKSKKSKGRGPTALNRDRGTGFEGTTPTS